MELSKHDYLFLSIILKLLANIKSGIIDRIVPIYFKIIPIDFQL